MITILGRLKKLELGIQDIKEPIREMGVPERWIQPMVDELAREVDSNILERLRRLFEEQRENGIELINVPFQPYQPYQPHNPYTTPEPYIINAPLTVGDPIVNPFIVGEPFNTITPYMYNVNTTSKG